MYWFDNHKVLFIGGSDSTSANTVCISNMAEELKTRGYRVWIISEGDEFVNNPGCLNGCEVWTIPASLYTRLSGYYAKHSSLLNRIWFKIFSILRHFFLLPIYPITAPLRTLRVEKKARRLIKKYDIRLIITTYHSYENIYAGLKIKKSLGERIRVVSYHLDLRTVTVNSSPVVRDYVRKHSRSSLLNEYSIVDKILVPFSGINDMEKLVGSHLEKVYYVGFPVYLTSTNNDECALPFSDKDINISYIGTLSLNNRNPIFILDVLQRVSTIVDRKIVVHFWGHIGEFGSYIQSSPVAVYHGTIDNRYVRHVFVHSDFLLNIGNAMAYNMLPSKIFGMFSSGKPIINVVAHPEDATKSYFEMYSHSIDVCSYDPTSVNVDLIAKELTGMMDKPVKQINGLFDSFKPKTICDTILQ